MRDLFCFNIQEKEEGGFMIAACHGQRKIPEWQTNSIEGASFSVVNEYYATELKNLTTQTKQ